MIDPPLCRRLLDEELTKLKAMVGDAAYNGGRYQDAARIFTALIEAPRFPEWLTIPAYEQILRDGA